MTAAAAHARELGHHCIRAEHLVLGLLALPDELAAHVLSELGITLEGTRRDVKHRLGSRPSRPTGSLVVAPQTKPLLEVARAQQSDTTCVTKSTR